MSGDEHQTALQAYRRAGRESSRLSVMFRFAIASRFGLTVTDAECLDFLMDAGSATAGDLARQTNLTTGAITGMIRRLEKAGYVASERDPADRRRVIVTPVPDRLEEGKARRRDPRRPARELLPVHRIPGHRQRGAPRRRDDARGCQRFGRRCALLTDQSFGVTLDPCIDMGPGKARLPA